MTESSTDRDKALALVDSYDRYLTAYRGEEERVAFIKAIADDRAEVRRETWEAAIKVVENMPIVINRTGVRKGGDLNGWHSAQQGAINALKATGKSK